MPGTPLPLALAVFFASGSAALIYQVIWQRMLALFSGADVFSVTLIVSAFMAGLGCGNLAGGHLADRLSRAGCLALFALAEAAVGGFALLSRWLFYDLLYGRLGAADLSGPALTSVLFLSVVWPTFFMGISLPLLARGLTGGLEVAARTVASLYGVNTLGAAAGALATPWILLRHLDMERCLWIGAALNLACALAALPLSRWIHARERSAAPGPAQAGSAANPGRAGPVLGLPTWLLVYALSGAIALSLEIAWFRALGVMQKSNSFTFGTLLGVYLAGVGSGSLVGAGRAGPGARAPARHFLLLQTGIALYAGLALAFLVGVLGRWELPATLWRYFGRIEGLDLAGEGDGPLRLLLYGVLPLALIGPPTFLMGLSFPYLQRAVQTDALFIGRRVGWLQTANIAGSLLGSLLTGFVLLPRLGTAGTFRALMLLAAIFPLLRASAHEPGARRGPSLAAAAAVAAAALLLPGGGTFWARLHGAAPADVLAAEDAAGVSVIREDRERGEQLVMADGREISSFPYGGLLGVHTLLGAFPVLVHSAPRRVAVIGVGSGDTAYAAACRPEVAEVVAVEILGSQISLLREFERSRGEPSVRALLSDPRIRIAVDDGLAFLRRTPQRFDVIEADALRPSAAFAGNLYSLEYFALLRERLAPGGIAVSWLPTERTLATFARAFPYVVAIGDVALGSASPIRFDRAELGRGAREPFVREHFARVGIDFAALLETPQAAQSAVRLLPRSPRQADVNRDLFRRTSSAWSGPGCGRAERRRRGPPRATLRAAPGCRHAAPQAARAELRIVDRDPDPRGVRAR